MLTTLGQPLSQDRGYYIGETLEGLGMTQQLSLACRTHLAMLLLRGPNAGGPKAQRDAFKTVCTEVRVWLREDIAEIQRVQRTPTTRPRKSRARPKVGHA